MTPQARKARTEAILKAEGVPFLPSLPCVEPGDETQLRVADEVGFRIASLFCVVGYAFDVGAAVFTDYLREHGLWEHLTPREISFLTDDTPDRQTVANFTWRCEALFMLMWSVRLFDALPLPRSETVVGEIVARFPSVDQSPLAFIQGLQLRPKSEILDASDLIYRLHWATRQARLDGGDAPAGLRPDLVQEWHHAINWITCYDEAEWDDVGTDT